MRLLVFDLDGTLIDSVPDLTDALNRTLAAHDRAPFTPADIAPMVGDGAGVLLRRACAARGWQASEAMVADYIADYTAHAAEKTRPYPGIPEALATLRDQGWRMAVCTNKPAAAAEAVLAALGLAGFFAALGGGDSFAARKPDPAHLLGTIARAGGWPARSVMLGDHANDIHAAAGAGVACLFAGWGYGTPAMAEGARQVPAPAAIPEAAAALLPG